MLSRSSLRRAIRACPACNSIRLASTSSKPTALPPQLPDISICLTDPDVVKRNLRERKFPVEDRVVDDIRMLEKELSGVRKELQNAREKRNVASSSTSRSTNAKGNGKEKDKEKEREEAQQVKATIKKLTPIVSSLEQELNDLALRLPNTSHPSTPIGDESQARIIKTSGPPIPSPSPPANKSLDHLSLTSPEELGWTNFPAASLISGPSWPFLLKEGALLEFALIQYAMSIAVRRGFTPVIPPDVIKSEVAERCGFRPRDGEAQQTYYLADGIPGDSSTTSTSTSSTLCLAGTAEIPLVALSAATTYSAAELPLKFVGLGRAFRAEAGARGADSRGLYRVHQFSKVEMLVVCEGEEEKSDKLLEELREVQEEILEGLGLSLRVLDMPTQELGASAYKKYDIEAWMPGRGKWGELSSASNCTSYQARRLGIRYRPSPTSTPPPRPTRPPLEDLDIPTPAAFEATAMYPELVPHSSSSTPKSAFAHTLNGTAAAVPRLIVAILENGAVLSETEPEGKGKKVERVRLPFVLKKFWLGDTESEGGIIEWAKEGEALRKE